MRTIGIVFASLLVSQVAFADVQPRSEPASPETNDADYTRTKYVGPSAELVTDVAPVAEPEQATVYLPVIGTWFALDTLRPCNGTQLGCRGDNAKTVFATDGLLATSLALPRTTETTLHLVPSLAGVGVWSRF